MCALVPSLEIPYTRTLLFFISFFLIAPLNTRNTASKKPELQRTYSESGIRVSQGRYPKRSSDIGTFSHGNKRRTCIRMQKKHLHTRDLQAYRSGMPQSAVTKAVLAEEAKRMERGESVWLLPSVGGKARSKALTPERRSEIAKLGALARWANPKPKPLRRKTQRELRDAKNTGAAA